MAGGPVLPEVAGDFTYLWSNNFSLRYATLFEFSVTEYNLLKKNKIYLNMDLLLHLATLFVCFVSGRQKIKKIKISVSYCCSEIMAYELIAII
jgi:hypothetical protein